MDSKLEKASALNSYSWRLSDHLTFLNVALNLGNVAVCGLSTKRDISSFVRIVLISIVNNYVDCFIYNRLTFKTGCFTESLITNAKTTVTRSGETRF